MVEAFAPWHLKGSRAQRWRLPFELIRLSSHRPLIVAGGGEVGERLLNQGTLGSRLYLKPESVKLMNTIQTGDLTTGFTEGNGWGWVVAWSGSRRALPQCCRRARLGMAGPMARRRGSIRRSK